MSWHPLLLTVTAFDALALLFALYAALPYGRVLLDWSPEAPTRRQLALEASLEVASLSARASLVLFVAATLAWLVAVTVVLPPLVPGAMCGTGVLTSMRGEGEQALAMRAAAIALAWVWRVLDRLGRAQPRPPDVPRVARWHLLVLPLLALSALYTLRAARNLDPHTPVDCCTRVYDTARTVARATTTWGIPDAGWLWAAVATGVLLASLQAYHLARPAGTRLTSHMLALASAPAWLLAAGVTLVRVLSAYHYEVLHHHCPWCLFLPAHHAVGYPLLLAFALTTLGTLQSATAARHHRRHRNPLAFTLTRSGAAASLAGLLLFAAFAVAPALLWRLRYGVWMGG